jgi:hypothetical protein
MSTHNYEEGTFSSVNGNSWTQVTVDPYKKISPNIQIYSPTIIRTANRFEVLHNLDDDGTQSQFIQG